MSNDIARRQGARTQPDFLKQAGLAHLQEHIQPVVARRAVRADRNGQPGLQILRDRRDAGSEFQICRRAVKNPRVRLSQDLPLMRLSVHAMREADVLAGHADGVQILHVVHPCAFADEFDLRHLLRRMRVEKEAAVAGILRGRAHVLARAAQRKPRGNGQTEAIVVFPAFQQKIAIGERVVDVHRERLVSSALVHQAVRDHAHQPHVGNGLKRDVCVAHGLHGEERRGSAFDQLGAG